MICGINKKTSVPHNQCGCRDERDNPSRYHSTSQDQKCPVHLVVRITAPPAFCYLPYVIRLSQKELQDQFKESFCCLAPSGSSLDRNNPFTSSLQRLSKVLNFCIIVSFALSFVKPKVGKKTACGGMEDVAYATRSSRSCTSIHSFLFFAAFCNLCCSRCDFFFLYV